MFKRSDGRYVVYVHTSFENSTSLLLAKLHTTNICLKEVLKLRTLQKKAAASQKLSYIQAKIFEIGKTRKQYSLLWFCIWRRLKFVKLTAARGRHCSHRGHCWGHCSGIFHFLFFSQSSDHFSAQMGGRGWRVISGTCSPPFWPGLMLRMGLLLLLLLRLMLWLGQVLLQLVLLLLLNSGCKYR